MQTLLKQSIIGGLSAILITAIAVSVGTSEPSVFEGRATYTDLIISEYYESNGGTHKAIEIYNGTGNSVSLSNYSLVLYTNGSTGVSAYVNLSGTLNDGATWVVYNSSTTRVSIPGSNVTINNTVINFNGDDTIALYNNGGTALAGTTFGNTGTVNGDMSDETLIDIIGVIGQDGNNSGNSAFEFTSANNNVFTGTTVNSILVRKRSITSPNSIFTGSEWLCFPVVNNTAVGLQEPDNKTASFGSHSSSTIDIVYAENYAYFLLNTTQNKSGSCTIAGLDWNTLSSAFDDLTSNEKSAYKNNSNSSTNNANSLFRYNYLRSFNTDLPDFINAA